MKRILIFLATNLAVMLTLSVAASVLGVNRFLTQDGLNLGMLLGFAAIFGFGGAFISLLMSKWVAKMSVGAQVIETPRNGEETWLVNSVRRMAEQAGIGMPEVAIYDSPEINAFATGATRNSSLVAVSTGLLRGMTRDEAEAVLAHEVSHIANGDMVTMTLIQGVLNTFVIFISRVVGWVVDQAMSGNRDEESSSSGPGIAYYVTYIVLEIVLGVLASIIVMWFSRQREYRADAGAAKLTSSSKMIAALERLKSNYDTTTLPERVSAFGIKGGRKGGFLALFSSHPDLDDRIQALRTRG